jgi:hypothetical protein
MRISCTNCDCEAALTAVRRRLMKAVFFFMDESREPCTGKRSDETVSRVYGGDPRPRTLLAIPSSQIELTKLS